jgi:uncharacterized protein (DUF1697 family)
MITIAGFLRGINVGGHHKVPMPVLREKLKEMGCKNVKTLLNSGNIIFDTEQENIGSLEQALEDFLSRSFGFTIPVILKIRNELSELADENPFQSISVHKDIRLYVSFLKDEPIVNLSEPYVSEDESYTILSVRNKVILSVLNLSVTNTPKGMDTLEKLFGKNITTRNWNTVLKVIDI